MNSPKNKSNGNLRNLRIAQQNWKKTRWKRWIFIYPYKWLIVSPYVKLKTLILVRYKKYKKKIVLIYKILCFVGKSLQELVLIFSTVATVYYNYLSYQNAVEQTKTVKEMAETYEKQVETETRNQILESFKNSVIQEASDYGARALTRFIITKIIVFAGNSLMSQVNTYVGQFFPNSTTATETPVNSSAENPNENIKNSNQGSESQTSDLQETASEEKE